MPDFDADPPTHDSLRSFAEHLADGLSFDGPRNRKALDESAAYLEGYAARLRFPTGITPTDESMRSARGARARAELEYACSPREVDDSRVRFANGWYAADRAMTSKS